MQDFLPLPARFHSFLLQEADVQTGRGGEGRRRRREKVSSAQVFLFVCLFLSPRPEASRSASRVIHYRFQLMLLCRRRPSSRLSAEPRTCPQRSCLLLCFASPSGESVAPGVLFFFFFSIGQQSHLSPPTAAAA